MNAKVIHQSLAIALILAGSLASSLSFAETRSDVYNGATCTSYPPYNAENAVPYQYYMYGFRQSVYCHFTMPDDWTVQNLAYVLFMAEVATGTTPLRVRLCVYRPASYTCGSERTIAPGGAEANWVEPPRPLPTGVTGAYIAVRFPTDRITVFRQFVPVWSR